MATPCTQEHRIEKIEEKVEHIPEIALTLKYLKTKIDEVHEQTKKTNGRVNSLERWKWLIVGGGLGINGLLGAAVTMLVILGKFALLT